MSRIWIFLSLERLAAASLVVGVFLASASAISLAAPIVPHSEKTPSLTLPADFTVIYGYDRNGNRTAETGPASVQTGEADACGNGSGAYAALFLNGIMVSSYPVACP